MPTKKHSTKIQIFTLPSAVFSLWRLTFSWQLIKIIKLQHKITHSSFLVDYFFMSTPATNPTSRHLTTTTTNSRTLSKTAEPGNSSTSSIQQSPPSPRAHSKSILTIALQKAQSAVLLDSANNVAAALAAYKQTVRLLSQVIDKAANEADRQRLQNIVSYSCLDIILW